MEQQAMLMEGDPYAEGAVQPPDSLGSALLPFFDSLPWPVIVLDDGGRVLSMNRAMRARRGTGEVAPYGTLQELFPEYHAALKGVAPWLTPQEAEVTRDGAHGAVHERVIVRCLPKGACVLIEDRTRLRELETADVQTARLASLGFMLAGACHEISNPLTAIYSMVQMLQTRTHTKASPETIEKGLATIAANVKRLLDISRTLVGFSRVDDEPRMPFRVDESVDEALVALRQARHFEHVELERHPDPRAMTFGNQGQMQEVFYNIFLNAIQAMDGRGHLMVRTHRPAPGRVEVAIHDSGPGIAPQFLGRLFDPFFTTKPVGKGTGLGLSISNEITREHGGSIRVENDVAKGAWFYVQIPACEKRR
jgi:two-component system, NtrC family, sensor kinase